jgi:hypothetical protein
MKEKQSLFPTQLFFKFKSNKFKPPQNEYEKANRNRK